MIKAPKLLFSTVNFTDEIAQWQQSGFAANKTYQWRVKLNVSQQSHGDDQTTVPYIYNGDDITEGMYISTTNNARILKIITIEAQTASNVQAIVEDDELLNILQSGEGIIPDSEAIIFQVVDGIPLLYPLPAILPAHFNRGFAEEIISRFRYRGKHDTVSVELVGHNFQEDRSVWLSGAGVYNNSGDGVEVGTIIEIGTPSTDYFRYKPSGNIIFRDIDPTATVGQVLYSRTDIPGGFYTTTAPSISSTPVLIKIDTKKYLTIASTENVQQNVTVNRDTIVVDTIADRDALIPSDGLQCYVRNSDPDLGVDDWSLWIYVDNVWNLIQSEDITKPSDFVLTSTRTDTGTGNFVLGQIEANQVVQTISINVTSPYNTGTLTVGELGNADLYADQDNFDMTQAGTYISRIPVQSPNAIESEIQVFHNSLTGVGAYTIMAVKA